MGRSILFPFRRVWIRGINSCRESKFRLGERNCSSAFAWHALNSSLWRAKVAEFAHSLVGSYAMDELKAFFGPKWAFLCAPAIFDTKLEDDPDVLKLEGEYEPRPVAKTPGPSEVEKAFRWAVEEGAFMRAYPEILEFLRHPAFDTRSKRMG